MKKTIQEKEEIEDIQLISPYLTNEEKNQIGDWFDEKSGSNHQCSTCGLSDWSVGDTYVVAPIYSLKGSFYSRGPMSPLVVLMCKNCANTQFYNAIAIGLKRATLFSKDGENG